MDPDISVLIFPKDELDKANKDKKHYPLGFQVWDSCSMQKYVDNYTLNIVSGLDMLYMFSPGSL